jgi:ubiquinone/menaquinone biosynthesis C-methylase UbiE
MDLRELASQLRKPEGNLGIQVAEMMNKGNLVLNQWAIETLQLKEGDAVLEIGMGNGFFVHDILSVHPYITYKGIDYSELMIQEAIILNRDFVKNGRAAFFEGSSSALPFPDHSFSKIMAVNTIYFWEDHKKELSEMKRVLAPGGKIVFGLRNKKTMEHMPFTEYGFTKYNTIEVLRLLESHQLKIIDITEKKEPAYLFNGSMIEMENIIVSCTT